MIRRSNYHIISDVSCEHYKERSRHKWLNQSLWGSLYEPVFMSQSQLNKDLHWHLSRQSEGCFTAFLQLILFVVVFNLRVCTFEWSDNHFFRVNSTWWLLLSLLNIWYFGKKHVLDPKFPFILQKRAEKLLITSWLSSSNFFAPKLLAYCLILSITSPCMSSLLCQQPNE